MKPELWITRAVEPPATNMSVPRDNCAGDASFAPRACLPAGRRRSPRRAGCRWRSPCRPGRCSTRKRPPRTGPAMTLPSWRSTSPSMETASPPMVKPEYIAWPSERSNAAHGPVSCAAMYSGCLWKSGSSPRAAFSLYRLREATSLPSGIPSAASISSTVSQPSMNRISGISGHFQVCLVDDQERRLVRLLQHEGRCA